MNAQRIADALERLLINPDERPSPKEARKAVADHEASLRSDHSGLPRWGRGKTKKAVKKRQRRAAEAILALVKRRFKSEGKQDLAAASHPTAGRGKYNGARKNRRAYEAANAAIAAKQSLLLLSQLPGGRGSTEATAAAHASPVSYSNGQSKEQD